MIIAEDNFILVHMHKGAGTSVGKGLLQALDESQPVHSIGYSVGDRVRAGHRERRNGIVLNKHSTALDIKKYCGDEVWSGAYKIFTSVRDPWDRTVSFYHHAMKINGRDPKRYKKIAHLSLEEFVLQKHFLTESILDFICDESGRVIVDYIMDFDRLDRDFRFVSKRCGLDRAKLKKKNLGTHRGRNYKDQLSPQAADLISRHFADEIEFFNFAFDRDDVAA